MPTYQSMPQKETRMRSSQRTRRSLARLFTWATAIVLITAFGATAAFAWSGGSWFRTANHSKTANHSRKAQGTAVSSGYRVSRLRFSRHHEYRPPAPTPTPEPAPTPPPPDTTPPNTSISSSPASSTTSTSASFAFSSTESGSSFECKLDSAGYAGCTSPKSYAGLGIGTHQVATFGMARSAPRTQRATLTPPQPYMAGR